MARNLSRGRSRFLTVATCVTVIGVLCALAAGAFTYVGGMETAVRPVAFAAMVSAVVAVAGAVLHPAQSAKAWFAVAAVASLIAGSSLFGLSYS
ncbi:hypothetical protein FB566_4389 [Stackebrandtia endophytica]|uniref:Uncharacterized protein n=1 Tax=Stackebrandtia endophytica TaxID=1496996 RepID=A0A543B1S2_9ACTN|nr:hypothetical protein [Stackebrandtia endophytica]TQL78795.1 hypothetical protein FB566_4389 [Stackebrandtia endophytica]